MIQTAESYVDDTAEPYTEGTAARQVKYDVYEENKVLKRKRIQKANNRIKLTSVMIVMAIFSMLLIVMLRYAVITKMNYEIDKYNHQYAELKDSNRKLAIDIEKNMDLNKIKRIAEERLGMQKPDKYQIVYIKVPKSDCTMLGTESKGVGETGNMFAVLFNRIGKLAHLLE